MVFLLGYAIILSMTYSRFTATPVGGANGTRYGALVITGVIQYGRKAIVSVICDCGKTEERPLPRLKYSVKTGRSVSCRSCTNNMIADARFKRDRNSESVGKKYGRLVVSGFYIDESKAKSRDKSRFKCVCDCGFLVDASVSDVLSGNTQSCGCLQKDTAASYGKLSYRHMHSVECIDIGVSSVYKSWEKIKECVRKGVIRDCHMVCHEMDPKWEVFENFLSDFGKIKSNEMIARRSKKLPWEKDNCYITMGYRAKPKKPRIGDA